MADGNGSEKVGGATSARIRGLAHAATTGGGNEKGLLSTATEAGTVAMTTQKEAERREDLISRRNSAGWVGG